MNTVEMITAVAAAVLTLTGEGIHTVQTFHRFSDERISYIVVTAPGRSFRVVFDPEIRKGQITEAFSKVTYFSYGLDGKVSFSAD